LVAKATICDRKCRQQYSATYRVSLPRIAPIFFLGNLPEAATKLRRVGIYLEKVISYDLRSPAIRFIESEHLDFSQSSRRSIMHGWRSESRTVRAAERFGTRSDSVGGTYGAVAFFARHRRTWRYICVTNWFFVPLWYYLITNPVFRGRSRHWTESK
jgi:hypothetical protein